ncbi:MAG TPA: tyrosine-type recombinase/integrase [Microvirga sp.]|jgi:integrase|nr:tyrosine-type recombinase/integrase [Microvirga sp.]
MRLNAKTISALSCPPDRSELIAWDDELSGFGIRCLPGGARTWFVQFRLKTGAQRRTRIGRFPIVSAETARAKARHILAEAMLGKDPAAEVREAKERAKHTLGAIADRYLVKAKARLRPLTYAALERHLTQHWKPLRSRPIDEITRREIASRLDEISAERGAVAGNRARSSLSSLFAWAMGEGLASSNPTIGTNKPQAEEKARETLLDTDQLRTVRSNAGDGDFAAILRLLILTGVRRDECGGMRWSEIDLKAETWTIPAGRMKGKREHLVPLPRQAVEILAALPRGERDEVFGRGKEGYSGWSKGKRRVDERLGQAGAVLPEWTLHDLRRSFATGLERLAIPPHVISAALAHTTGKASAVGNVYMRHHYVEERRAAMQLWADHLDGTGAGTNVVPIRAAAS